MDKSTSWRRRAEQRLITECAAAPRTPIIELSLPALPGRRLVFKDESAHATGSLKHRLARSLLLHALRKGLAGSDTPLFDASSGNTAISEAYFAQLVGLDYFAVIPANTSEGKQALIRQYSGECLHMEPGQCCKQAAAQLAAESGGCFLDQFTNAAVATDWRRDNVITEFCRQLEERGLPQPDWFVMGAGTGGTSTCAGRYFRNHNSRTRLMVVDPENSAFFDHYACRVGHGCLCASRIEGIGRPTVEPSFNATLVDRICQVPDAASFAAARWLSQQLGRSVGLSTGTHLVGAIELLETSEFVTTLIADDGRRYAGRLDNDNWIAEQGMMLSPWLEALDRWHAHGAWQPPGNQSLATISRTTA